MDIIKDTIEFNIPEDTVVTIGKFDGIHNGHLRILDRMREFRARGYKLCVLTFDRSPAALGFGKDKKVLMSMKEKERAFDALGIDYLVEFPFYEKTASIDAMTFIEEFIVDRLHAKAVVVGTDCSFGQGAKGNAQMLRDYGPIYDYEVCILEKLMDGDREISSSYLRELIQAGDVAKVTELSYRPAYVTGKFKVGPSRISTYLNGYFLTLPEEKVLPKPGVYYSMVFYEDSPYPAITAVFEEERMFETYIYHDVKGISSQEITLGLLCWVRDNVSCDTIEELNLKVREDIFEGQKWHKENFGKYMEMLSTVEC